VDERCASIEETDNSGFMILEIKPYIDDYSPELSISLDQVGIIIDGQHRLKGLEDAGAGEFEVALSIFIGIDEGTQASIFSIVNLAQTKVNKSLVYDLFSLSKNRSPEKTCHEIAVALDSLPDSPFENRIKRLGTATAGRFEETLSQATIVKGILPYISNDPVLDRDQGRRLGFWEPIDSERHKLIFRELFRRNEDEKILKILVNYFNAVKDKWTDAWNNTGRGNIINKTNGFNAFIRFLRPAYLNFTQTSQIVTEQSFRELFDKVSLTDSDFSPENFLPGSSGATALYRRLVEDTGVATK
jgi:DGQHR domain-containing protein